MSDFLPAFQAEWMSTINTVWPEIVLPGSASVSNFFTALQALRTNIVNRMADGSPSLPYAFLCFGHLVNEPAWCMDRHVTWAPVTVFYIDSEANGATQLTVNAKLYALSSYVYSRGFTTFTEVEQATIDSSDMNPANEVLAVMSQVRAVGGSVSWQKLLPRDNS